MSVSDTARALNDALDTELGRIDRSNSNSEGRSDQDPALGSDDLARRPRSPTQHSPLDLDVAAAAARNSTTFGQQSSIVAADASVPSAGTPLGPGSPLSPGTDHQEHCVSSRHSTPLAQRYPASELPPKPASSRSSSRPSEPHEPRHGQGASAQSQGSGRKPPQHPSSAARSSNSSEEAAGAGFDRRSAARDEPIPSVDEILAQLSSASRSITLTGAARSAQNNATAASSSDHRRGEKNATRKTTSESTEREEPPSKHTRGSGFDAGESAKDRERSRTRSPSNHGRGRRFSSETSDTSSPSPESSPPSRDPTPGRTHGRYHIDHPRPSDQKSSARSERRQREKDSRRPDHSSRDPRGEARDIVDEYRERYPQLEKGAKHQSSASRPPSQYESGRFDRELQRGYELERARHETPRGQRQRDRHRDVEDRDRAFDAPCDRRSPRTKRYYASPDTDEPSSSDAPPVQLSPRMSSRKAAAQTAQNRTQEILAAAGVTLSPRDYQHSRDVNPPFAPETPHGSVASPGRTITGLSSIEGTATKQPFDSAPRSFRAAQRRRDQDASAIGVSGIGVVPAALSGSLASMHMAQQSRESSSSPSRDRAQGSGLGRSGAAAGVPTLRDSKLFRSTSAISNGSSRAAVSPRAVAVDGLLSARSQQRQVATPALALALINGDGADCVTPPPRGPMVPGDVTTHPRPGSATRLGLGRSPRSVSAQKRRTSEERQHSNHRSASSGAMVPSASRSASAHRSASQRNAGNGLYETADAMLAVRQAQDEVHELRQALLQATQEVHGARQDASLAQQQLASSETEKAELTKRLEEAATELAQRNHHIVKLESDHAAREAVLAVQSNASAQLERKLDDQRWAHDNETGKLQQDLRGAAVKIEELLRENHALRKARDTLDAKCVQLAREADHSRAFFEKPLKAFMQAANPVLTVSKAHRDDRLLTDYARQIAPAADPSTSRDRPDRTFSSDSDSSSGWERRSGKQPCRRDKYERHDDGGARRGGDRSYERPAHRDERGSDSARRGHRSSRHGRNVSHSSRGSSRDEAIDWRPSTSRPGRDASDDERRHRSSPPPHRSRSYAMSEASKPQRWPLALAATPETDALGVHSHLQLRSARRRSPSPDLW